MTRIELRTYLLARIEDLGIINTGTTNTSGEVVYLSPNGDDVELAMNVMARNDWPVKIVSTMLTERGVVAAFADPTDGEAVLQSLESVADVNPLVKRALDWLTPANGGVDFGEAATRGMLDALQVAGVLTSTQVLTLKATAEQRETVTHYDIASALGRMPQ
jgi:hypothetical protein